MHLGLLPCPMLENGGAYLAAEGGGAVSCHGAAAWAQCAMVRVLG